MSQTVYNVTNRIRIKFGMKGNVHGIVFPNEGCGIWVIVRRIAHGDLFEIEDNEVFGKGSFQHRFPSFSFSQTVSFNG